MMRYTLFHMRKSWLPYCIDEVAPGEWIFRNREYRPLGVCVVDGPFLPLDQYQRYRIDMTPERLTAIAYPKRSRDLGSSVSFGKDGLRNVYLYNDGCQPFDGNATDTKAYLRRLAVLQKAIVE